MVTALDWPKTKQMTKSQLRREVAFLIRKHLITIRFGKRNNMVVTVQWNSHNEADVGDADFECFNSAKLEPGDWSKVHKFNARIRAAIARSDELAVLAGAVTNSDKQRWFEENILFPAEEEDEAKGLL